ncbi:MAG: hypothetical protein NTW96_02480 [Planctomycetia bacterium]|nr:hypothetical protein [Planctomycetia bacterium]
MGYLGGLQGESIRTRSQIPKLFRRDERGTDIIILGFRAERTWDEELELSVLEYFWPAINFGDLEVRIGDRTIAKDNLGALLEARSGAENFTAHLYYSAYLDPTASFDKSLRHLKAVSVRIRTGETELPKRIAMVRQSGMVIYHRQSRCAIPFCGVFMCRNDVGNTLLRDMEPPRHDTWNPDFPDRGANKKIENEFVTYIRECTRQLSVRDDVKIIPFPELSRFLPDDDETPEEPFGSPASEEQPPADGFPATPPAPKPRSPIPVQKMPERKPMQPDGHRPAPHESGETEEGSSEAGGTGGGPAGDGNNNVEGGAGSGGAVGAGSSSPTSGAHGGGAHAKPAIPIRFRAYPKDGTASVYAVTIHPIHDGQRNGIISLLAVGDDAKEPLSIRAARLADGTSLPSETVGKIGPLAFPPTGPINLEVELCESRKVAMEVSAHEA